MMKGICFFILSVAGSILMNAQSSKMAFYYPDDATPYKRICKGIQDINGDFDVLGRIKTFSPLCMDRVHLDCFVVIGFKLFTHEPLWVWTNNPKAVPESIKAFDFHDYIEHRRFEADLNRHIFPKEPDEWVFNRDSWMARRKWRMQRRRNQLSTYVLSFLGINAPS
jgi:hypothetical protein